MARKSVVTNHKMLDSVDISSNQTSNTTSVKYLDYASIHVSWSGVSPVGAIRVQARNGKDDSWRDLDFGSAIAISGNSGEHDIILSKMSFSDIRIAYDATSGTGALDAIITAKTEGA